jgi:hypothetical protein
MTTDNFCFYLQNRLVQTSQTGGQRYPPLVFPGYSYQRSSLLSRCLRVEEKYFATLTPSVFRESARCFVIIHSRLRSAGNRVLAATYNLHKLIKLATNPIKILTFSN